MQQGDTFWTLLRDSVIIQGLLTIGLWGAIIYLSVIGKPVPEIMTTGGVAILGFWFGSKVESAKQAAIRNMQ